VSERGGFGVVLTCAEAVVELAEEPVVEVAECGCVPIPMCPTTVVVCSGAG
jgi:hypothetical protein